jgi:signal transduction histidine kinase
MGRIKDLQHLLSLMVHIVTRTVRIEHGAVYLLHRESGNYTLKASKNNKTIAKEASFFPLKSPFIQYFYENKEPVLYEELKQMAQDKQDKKLFEVLHVCDQLNAELVVPCIIENRMLAFIVLGKKRDNKLYTHDDLVVFSILASQSALAIENAMFCEDAQKTTEQLFKAEKMATIGTMADGLSHQINNRLHAIGFVVGDLLDTVKLFQQKHKPKAETQEMLDDMMYSLGRIQENVKRGGEIVGGLLRYTRKGAEGVGPVDLNELIDASVEMAQFKVKFNQFKFQRNFNGSVPKIKGNFTQLQEVFFNVIDNAYDAIMQRKHDYEDESFEPKLDISVSDHKRNLDIIIVDTGIGVKSEDMGKIFTPFFTTKATAKKGTGLGMYVIRQIIEENHGGEVKFESSFKRGSKLTITLPKY